MIYGIDFISRFPHYYLLHMYCNIVGNKNKIFFTIYYCAVRIKGGKRKGSMLCITFEIFQFCKSESENIFTNCYNAEGFVVFM